MVCTHIAHLSPFVCLSLSLSFSLVVVAIVVNSFSTFRLFASKLARSSCNESKNGQIFAENFPCLPITISICVFFPPIQSSFSFGLSYVCNQQMPPNMDVIVIWLIEFIAVLAQNISSFSKEPPRQCTHEHPQLKMINITAKQQQRQQQRQQIFHGIYHLFIQIISILLTRMVYRSIVW